MDYFNIIRIYIILNSGCWSASLISWSPSVKKTNLSYTRQKRTQFSDFLYTLCYHGNDRWNEPMNFVRYHVWIRLAFKYKQQSNIIDHSTRAPRRPFPAWISIIKLNWSWDRIIFIMGIPILVRPHNYIETGPRTQQVMKLIFAYCDQYSYSMENNLHSVWLVASVTDPAIRSTDDLMPAGF